MIVDYKIEWKRSGNWAFKVFRRTAPSVARLQKQHLVEIQTHVNQMLHNSLNHTQSYTAFGLFTLPLALEKVNLFVVCHRWFTEDWCCEHGVRSSWCWWWLLFNNWRLWWLWWCVSQWKKKVPDEWQSRQAIPAMLQVLVAASQRKEKYKKSKRPIRQLITAIITEEKREAVY